MPNFLPSHTTMGDLRYCVVLVLLPAGFFSGDCASGVSQSPRPCRLLPAPAALAQM